MTEKDYSGATTSKIGKNAKAGNELSKLVSAIKGEKKHSEAKKQEDENSSVLSKEDIQNYKKAGEIAKKVKDYAKSIVKKDEKLIDIAEKIEAEILKLGGQIGFPVNLSIDDVAAHYTPTLRDEKKAEGLLKIDIGVHVNGCICDIAFSMDLTAEKKYTKLIEASEAALKSALEVIKQSKANTTLSQIGKAIQNSIESKDFSPIVNLSGHGLDEFDIHSGLTIPNYDTKSDKQLGDGAFAVEPFATIKSGSGMIYESSGSNIYHILKFSQPREPFAREVLEYIAENKKTLPFSQRELEKKFGSKALIAISQLKRAGIINEFAQLVEKSHSPVSQTETSLIVHDGKVEILVD
ncbi:MAG: type II methionyl aminopeptidase [Nanoarchaeota archaeon]